MASMAPPLCLAVPQHAFDLLYRPFLAGSKHAHPATVTSDERVTSNLIYRANKIEIGFWLPMQGEVKITRKDLPLRSVVKLNHVAFTVRSDFHAAPPV